MSLVVSTHACVSKDRSWCHYTPTGGGGYDDFFGDIPDWIKYENQNGYSVHVEFTPDSQSIGMVTLMQEMNEQA